MIKEPIQSNNSNYIFPFSTCERPSDNIAQPISASINAISTLILFCMMLIAKTIPVQLALFSYVCFEGWHTYSHMYHHSGKIQTLIVHILGYFMSFATLYAILVYSKAIPSKTFILLLAIFIAIDIYCFIKIKGISTIITGLIILLLIVGFNYYNLPLLFKKYYPYFTLGVFIIIGLFINEKIICQKMLEYKELPYHSIIEIIGLILFVMLGVCLLKMDV